MKKTMKRIIKLLLAAVMMCNIVFAEGDFVYNGEVPLFSENFDSASAPGVPGVGVGTLDGKKVLKLSGENASLSIKNNEAVEYGFSADLSIADVAAGSYAGLAISECEQGSYKLLIYPDAKKAKILKGNAVLAEATVSLNNWNNIKIAVKDGIIRAMLNGAVIMSVYDSNAITGTGSSVLSNGLTAYFGNVLLETESSYYYENFEGGSLYTVNSNELIPEETKGDEDGIWIIQKDEDKNVLTTKGYSSYAKLVYPVAKDSHSSKSAVILNVKSGDWNCDENAGLYVLARYQAGNMCYRLRFSGKKGIIEKVSPSNVIKTLAESAEMKNSVRNYYEAALETINEADGSVTINAYFDGKLIASAKDENKPYLKGDFAIEYTGGVRPLIDEVNYISIKEPLLNLYSEGRKNKAVDVYFNEDKIETPVFMEGNQALISANEAAKIAGASVISSTENELVTEKYGIKLSISANSSVCKINESEFDMQATAKAINGELYVPVRAVTEPYGAIVSYNDDEKTLKITHDATFLDGSNIYVKDNTILALEPDARSIRYIKILGSEVNITGENSPMWKLYYVDENVRSLNATKWIDTTKEGYGMGYGQTWQMGNCTATSHDAVLASSSYDKEKGKLTLNYTHDDADVTLYFTLSGKNVYIDSTVTNKSDYPIQLIQAPSDWKVNYSENNTIIVNQASYCVEFENVSYQKYTDSYMFNGFIVDGDNPFLVHYVQTEYGKSDKMIRATDSEMNGPKVNSGYFKSRKGTVVWAEKGESRDSLQISMGVYDNLKEAGEEWCAINYPEMRTLDEKAPEDIRDKMAHSYQFFSQYIKFSDLIKLADAMPGVPNHHIGHSTMHNRTDKNGNPIGNKFDAFPNYFPPDSDHGTEEELAAAISHITNDLGHLFMPRQSLFYYTEGSDFARDIGVEDESSLAMVRIDGYPQQGVWREPGYLASPSSEKAQEQYKEYFNKWEDMGSNIFFTNVIGAVVSLMHRYDFHPDAEAPDSMWNEIAKQQLWYSQQSPVFTEAGSSIRLPYTSGIMYDARWGKDRYTPADSYMLDRGTIIRVREDIFPLFFSKYAQQYPHNLSTDTGQISDKGLSYSLLYNIHMKNGLDGGVGWSDSKWRYFRNVAMIADVVQPYLYGKELMGEIDYDESTGIEKANYEGSIVIGNLNETPYRNKNDVISKYGFDFKSADGKVYGGIYDEYNGHRFDDSKIIMTRETDTGEEIYALTTPEAFDICVPTKVQNPKLTAHYPDGRLENIPYRKTESGILFTYPYFDVNSPDNPVVNLSVNRTCIIKTSKTIPYVEISETSEPYTDAAMTDSVIVMSSLDTENYSSVITLPDKIKGNVRVENYTGGAITAEVSITGNYFGKTADIKIPVNQKDMVGNYEFVLPLGEGIVDSGADLNVSVSGINPMTMNDKLFITRMVYPEMLSAAEAQTKYNIDNMIIDWNMDPANMPEGVTVTSHGAENPYGTGYVLENGDYLTVESDDLIFKDKVYFEILYKYNDLRQHAPGEQHIISPISGKGHGNRKIEFRYNPSMDAIRWLVTSTSSYNDLTNLNVSPEKGKWMHVIACYDGVTQRLIVNGNEVTNKYSKLLHTYEGGFKIGGTMDAEIAYLRIGGR